MKRNSRILAVVMALALLVSLGSITAFAEGEASGFTITISNALEGETYTAYKLMDATYLGTGDVTEDTPIAYYYEGRDTDALFVILSKYFQFDDPVEVDATSGIGKYYVKVVDADGNAIKYSQDAVAAMAAEINAGMVGETLTLEKAGEVKATGPNATIKDLEKGYYFVNTTLGSLCALDTVSNVEIQEKNTTTQQDKTVQEDSIADPDTAWGDKNDASIGDTVHFKTTITIGRYQKNVAFHDIMQTARLALVPNTIKVEGADGHYTVITGGNFPDNGTDVSDTFAVTFDNAWTSALTADTTVTIEYDAVLTANAVIGDAAAEMGTGNDNQSRVTYGDAQETPWDWTRTYTWSFDILKYTGENKTPLADAEFQLKQGENVLTFTLVSEGAAAQEAGDGAEATPATATVYRYDPEGKVTTLVSPVTGLIQVVGLDADTYTLTETKAPDGYNRLTADVTVVIDSNTDTDQGTDGAGQQDVTVSINEGDSHAKVEIENNSGTELPSTGGIGTTIFYIVGSILVVVAGVLLVAKKRMGADK